MKKLFGMLLSFALVMIYIYASSMISALASGTVSGTTVQPVNFTSRVSDTPRPLTSEEASRQSKMQSDAYIASSKFVSDNHIVLADNTVITSGLSSGNASSNSSKSSSKATYSSQVQQKGYTKGSFENPNTGGDGIEYSMQIEAEQRQTFLRLFIPSAIAAVVILGGGAMLIIKKRKAKMSKQ